ncbi:MULTISPECIES: tetratricopeptide repeat protein [unclassified Rhizobium]|uniref:tetratricopeptide repeat protein n=1 Tax=unclassified Rhizobium TaxID=2613769 RepID=UPI0007148719|nr:MULTISPECIES: tetratricopeptide repeat protein [unclassified Rhizobium]KQS88109.1 cellulose synthase [Rhizobium sp. Leaf391]KQT00606.1 cellulose synthase [Rhizobium sp. Leaf386]KQU09078.1 cellulose synthase [Rhizobium sp. Leaf453]
MKSTFIALSAAIIAVGVVSVKKPDYVKHIISVFSPAGEEERTPFVTRVAEQKVEAPAEKKPAPVFQEVKRPVQPPVDTVVTAAMDKKVDESALRYFASRGDTARLQAEISRLKALYPDWTPPKDPLAIPQNEDKQLETMWDLYAQGRYTDVRKAIAERQAAEPAWKAPADLIDRLAVAEARTRLINASDLKQYETVVRIGSETPSLLTCSEVDVLWRVAEAFFRTNKAQRANDAYTYILANCQNSAERLATVQKAAALLPAKDIEALLTREKVAPDGAREFDSIRDDLARRFVAEANADGKIVVSPEYVSRVERLAETGGLASDALLLGWYYLPRGDMEDAEKWFRRARDKEDSASASQGLSLVLIDRGVPQDAEDAMYRWRDTSEDAKAVYLAATANLLALDPPASIKSEVLKRIATETIKSRDAATAQQFGWYARALNQPQTAIKWFKTALGWKLDDEPSAYGLAVTYLQVEDAKGLAEIQRLWAGRSERIARAGEEEQTEEKTTELQVPATEEAAVVGGQARRPAARVVVVAGEPQETEIVVERVRPRGTANTGRGCKTTVDPQMLAPEAALTRGWCLMEMNRPMEAAAAFEVGLLGSSAKTREDAAYGQSLAYLRAGLASKAAVSAVKAPQNRKRAYELQSAILADKAVAAFDAGRAREAILVLDQLKQIGPERTDLLSLRGYAYLKLKRYADARQVFEALAAIGNRDGQRGLGILYRIFNDHE